MKKNLVLIVLLSVMVSFSATRPQSDKGQRVLVFTHATIINTAGGPNELDMTVVISGDRIADIKETGKIRLPQGAQVIDATGKFLIPGLWDMHAHWYDADYLPIFIANGVTGLRIMWGNLMHLKWREEIINGTRLGPRLYIGSPIIDGPQPVWPGSVSVSNEDDAREVVRKFKTMGYEFIKIYQHLPREAYYAIADESKKLGITFAGHLPSSITAIEASEAGQICIEHLSSGSLGILLACSGKEEELIKEREKAFEGVSNQPRSLSQLAAYRNYANKVLETYNDAKASSLFSLFAGNNTWQCPTLTCLRGYRYLDDKNFTDDARLKYMPEAERESWDLKNIPSVSSNTPEDWALEKKIYNKELEIAGIMNQAGVKFIAGTDVANPYCFPGFSLHDELSLFVQAGFTPLEALQTATYNAAEFLGQLDSLGTVEVGKSADLVLLDANPLEDINNTRKITAVVVGGKYYPRTSLDEMLVRIETLAAQKSIAENLLQTINEKDLPAAIAQYHELKNTQFDNYDFRESELNTLGYQLLRMNKIIEAIEIFKLNVEAYPQSSNVYDSLGEAYMINGDKELAINNYEKSLELNPKNSNAVEMLKKLKQE
ncbi:amidohydrolase family protein [bacterium]|nr:amidohydrolase family protein [bacterium]